jgi:group II intron reverse transcriptase/maturase
MIKEEETKSLPVTKQMVWKAYQKVKRNGGSAGIDGESLDLFQQDLTKNLYKIWNRLSSGSYFPPAVKEVSIPKSDGRERKLGIPTVGDRIAQEVIRCYLEPRLEAVFSDNSYGYRPLKSAHQAVEAVRNNVRQYAWVVDMDIKSFFDEVNHDLIMKALDCHVTEPWVKLYIRRWLEAPVALETGEQKIKAGKGTPQGGVISPLLANLFLHYVLDKWIEKNHPDISFVRYADDVILHCHTEEEAKGILASVGERMQACNLRLNDEKTKIVYCQDYRREKKHYRKKFDFLGFSFQPRGVKSHRHEGEMFLGYDCAISSSSRQKITDEIKRTDFHRWSGATIERIAEKFNPKLRGWLNYYGKYKRYEMNRVFRVFHFRLMKWVLNRYKSLRSSRVKAYQWIRKLRRERPDIFYHWSVGFYEI